MKHLISAQVILKPKSGIMAQPKSIGSENLESFMSDATNASQTRAHFENLGFEVGALVGYSFSISAPIKKFEQQFRTKILSTKQFASLEDGSLELPITGLPENVKSNVNAISFSAPPDFGPNNF